MTTGNVMDHDEAICGRDGLENVRARTTPQHKIESIKMADNYDEASDTSNSDPELLVADLSAQQGISDDDQVGELDKHLKNEHPYVTVTYRCK